MSPTRDTFRDLLGTLRRGWWLILACALLSGATAFVISLSQTKRYTASASLLFRDPAFDQTLFGGSNVPTDDPARQADTNLRLVRLRKVAERTAARPDVFLSAKQVHDAVEVSADRQADVVVIQATSEDPVLAAKLANVYGGEFIDLRREADRQTIFRAQRAIERQIAALEKQGNTGRQNADSLLRRAEQLYVLASLQTGNVELVERARPPTRPSSPRTERNTALGLLLGGLLGVGLVLLRGRLDRRLRTSESLEDAFGRPLLARVPVADDLREGLATPRSPTQDAFSTLWTNLRYFNVTRKVDSVLVTSSSRGDGKSTVALNLAAAATRTGHRALLLEADLRRPSLARVSRTSPSNGLTQTLVGATSIDEATAELALSADADPTGDGRHIDVIFAGPISPNPAEMLDSQAMRSLLTAARELYDLVVIDTPPISLVPDAIPLAQQVGAVVVVARTGQTTRDEAAGLKGQLAALDAPFVGVVENHAPLEARDYYYGHSENEVPSKSTVAVRS